MPLSHLLLQTLAALLMVAAVAALAWYLGFVGLGIVGVVILLACVRVELDQGGVASNSFAPDLYTKQLAAQQAATRSERAAEQLARERLRPWLRRARWLGLAIVAVAAAGFFWSA